MTIGARRRLLTAVVAVLLTGLMFLGAAVVGNGAPAAPREAADPLAAVSSGRAAGRDELVQATASLQARLERLPGDAQAWAALGAAYVQQARVTADPAFYDKAEGAFARSLREQPEDNEPALTGQASLAAGRHDFVEAHALARKAVAVNPFGAAAHGALGDALLELGRYQQAFGAFQRMVDLRPGVPSHARASYAWEIRGNIPAARKAWEQALSVAATGADASFVHFYLGELAFSQGNLRAADRQYRSGLERDASFVPLLAGRAKVAAARGQTASALRDYTTVVEQLPQPSYLAELGDLYASLGRHDEARAQYDLVLAAKELLAAGGVNVDLELALYDADHGRPREALRAARAEAQRRRSVFVNDAYAWALHVNGRSREALEHAQRAERLGTRSALFSFHKGMIEKSLGMRQAARADLRRALRINPHFSLLQAAQARAALEELGR